VVITHRFHPMFGDRLAVLGGERRGGRACLRCAGGPLGSMVVPVAWTDQAPPAASTPLTYEVLVGLAAAVRAMTGG
jgi:hypothetical protein